MRMTEQQLAEILQKRGKQAAKSTTPTKPKSNKYRNKVEYRNGWRFDSKAEAKRFDQLELLKQGGQVIWFLCQVPIRLPGHTTYRVDFQVLWADGQITFEDVKGVETQEFRMKSRQVLELYGIEIQLIRGKSR